MAKWKLILDSTYAVSKKGRIQDAVNYGSKWEIQRKNDLPHVFNKKGELSVIVRHPRFPYGNINISVARIVAHAFVDGFDMFNTTHELQLIDTSKRPKLKNLAAHVPQDIPESANLKVYLIEDLREGDIYEDCNGEWWKVEYITTKKINSTRVNDMYDTQEHSITEVKTVCFLDCAQLKKTLA